MEIVLENAVKAAFLRRISEFFHNKYPWKKFLPKNFQKFELSGNDALNIFCKFLHSIRIEGIEGDNDNSFFEYGLFDYGEGEQLIVSFTRQIVFEVNGELDSMKQIILNLYYEKQQDNSEFKNFVLWIDDAKDLTHWKKMVRESSGFSFIAQKKAKKFTVEYTDV